MWQKKKLTGECNKKKSRFRVSFNVTKTFIKDE